MTSETQNYRDTVLTPRTDFPMRAKLPQREPERLARWAEARVYETLQEKRRDAPTFILHDGPPYANGDIHLGHAMNKILKDIIVRYHSMKGRRAPYVPGWDCHGLPIEQQVLKKLGSKIHEMAPIEIRKKCHEYAEKFVGVQREQFKRLGIMGDWDRPYTTFDPKYEVGILSALRDLTARGLIRRGMKPVHWDPIFRTALAEAEIEYKKHVSDSIYVKFPLRESEKFDGLAGLAKVSIVIWTTTPWTLPANLAVCLHPRLDYVVVRSGEEHFIVAKGLLDSFVAACALEGTEVVGAVNSADLERAECDHPIFTDRTSLVILGEHVTLEAGTGCVHTAPGHGADDYVIGKKYGLPVVVPVDDRGRFTDEFPEMEGVSVFKANEPIIEGLRARGILLAASKFEHDYPFSWRSHKPIIFRATDQWFMELEDGDVRKRALTAIDESVKWIPGWGRDRIHGMVSQRPDWCLSRQRSWGVPIPAIRSKTEGKSILDVRILDAFIKVVAEKGTDAWFTDPLESFWPEGFVYEPTGETRADQFEKEWDILDVWFDSGASVIACLENDDRLSSPADLYLEGSDQHRGWFQSALLISIGARDRAPFREVLTHGFVLDGAGKAMSKSVGNVISPLDMMKQLGADILRLWVASTDYQKDVPVTKEVFARVADAYKKMRNALRFMIGNLFDFDPVVDSIEHESLEESDRFILARLGELVAKVDSHYERYEFHQIYSAVFGFCNSTLSAVYLDIAKDRLYCSAPGDPTRRASQTAIWHILDVLTRLLAPILAFTTDEAREFGPFEDGECVHLLDFPEAKSCWQDAELLAKWERLLALRDEVSLALEHARREKTIGHSLDASVELMPADKDEAQFFEENLALLKMLFIVSDIQVGAVAEGGDEGGDEGVRVGVRAAESDKCERCWMRDPDLGSDPGHPGLCPRCSRVMATIQVN